MQIVEHLSECDAEGSMTECVERHLDTLVPNCTKRRMALEGGRRGCEERRFLRSSFNSISYTTFMRQTSCLRTCRAKYTID